MKGKNLKYDESNNIKIRRTQIPNEQIQNFKLKKNLYDSLVQSAKGDFLKAQFRCGISI